MRVRIEGLENGLSQQISVTFASAIGRARGRWIGVMPEMNAEYEVEIEIPGTLRWGERINATTQMTPGVCEERGETLLSGSLQRFDGKVAEVMLAEDVILIEVDRVGCEMPCHVIIKTRDLQLFDRSV